MSDSIHLARILVPVDGSEYSRHAAAHAVHIARAYRSELIFLHVIDDQLLAQLAEAVPGDTRTQARERLVQQGEMYLRDVARLAEEHGLAHREVIADGDPCAAICDTASRDKVDLIVMGKIGRRGARRLLVGSITRRVIELSEQPTLVVTNPPPGGDATRARADITPH